MTDNSIVADIAAALWQLESQLQELNRKLDRVIGWEQGTGERKLYFIRTNDHAGMDES